MKNMVMETTTQIQIHSFHKKMKKTILEDKK